MGEAGEGQNITHQQKKMNVAALRAFRDRFDLDISDAEVEQVAFHRPPDDSPRRSRYLRERREALGGYLPQRRERVDEPLQVPRPGALQEPARGHRRARGVDHDGLRPGARGADPRQAGSEIGSCRSCPMSPDLRHGGDVPPARHLLARRAALRARGRRIDAVLQGEPRGADSPGGDQRGGGDSAPGSRPRPRTRTTTRR